MGRLIEGAPQPLGTERMILNPGSVGQPRDGDVRASYVVIDVEAMTYEHRRVYYDVRTTQELMSKAKLPERNITRLSYGW
jgi:diadenosine tetraphosphatase ApaH/serine/threonine PP2A family protein phosphatase